MNTDAPNVTDGYSGGDRGISPALDATLELLSNRRRRYALYYLRRQDGAVTVEELAQQVAAWEPDSTPDEERVLADLYHCQLPRLDDAGAVDYDSADGYVSLVEPTDEPLTEYLELAAREENVI